MAPSLKPGIVTGADYKTLIDACKAGQYALPSINCTGTNTINAVLEAAAKNKADVMIQLSNGGAEFYAGKGIKDTLQAKILGAVSAAHHIHTVAEAYGVCVVLHTDHANKKLIPWIEGVLEHSEAYYKQHGKPLFTSHMIDLSEESLEDNLSECARLLKRMAKIDCAIEIELGVTGGEEDGVGSDNIENHKLYTQPEDVLQAYDLLQPLGMVSIAASFGNVHGVYAPGNVQLRPEILKHSQELVQKTHKLAANPLDLVFHGGSGSEKDKIAEALTYGVFKMNIDTDTQFAFAHAVGEFVEKNLGAFKDQIDPKTGAPHKKTYDPRKWLRVGEEGMIKRLDEAFADLKSAGRTLATATGSKKAA